MLLRRWDREKDYTTLVNWWSEHDFGTVPVECLPPLGLMITDKMGNAICGGGLYVCDGTKFGFMEWVVGKNVIFPISSQCRVMNMSIIQIQKKPLWFLTILAFVMPVILMI